MLFKVNILIFVCFIPNVLTNPVLKLEPLLHPDAGLNVLELIIRHEYPLEQHWITTEDGYILGVHRIPHGRQNTGQGNRPAVLLMHGLLSSSADWVNMGPENSLGFLLADLGYDVWLGNLRGNTWSRNHTTLNPNSDDHLFWEFSWHEMGIFDIPATIDYITEVTDEERIFYIGHSQGTTAFYVMAAEKPEYNNRIRLMISLAPVAYMSHVENPFFHFLSEFSNTIEVIAQLIGLYEFTPHSQFVAALAAILCDDNAPYQEVCANILFLIGGFDSEQLNRTMIPVIVTNAPAGASVKQLFHYSQEINSGYFRKYDYGLIQNLIRYGQVTPPHYDIAEITAPVALFYAENDILTSVIDVNQLSTELPNVALEYRVDFALFTHLDFLWAIDVVSLVYNRVFQLMNEY